MRVLLTIFVLAFFFSPSFVHSQDVSVEEQRHVLREARQLIEERYVGVDRVPRIVTLLQEYSDALEGPVPPRAFAEAVTGMLRDASSDGHLGLSYSEAEIPVERPDGEQLTLGDDFEQWYGTGVNHGVERIERLDGNITLLELTAFPPAEMGGDVFAAAMTVAAQGEALIIDLRSNGGGAETVALILGYLVEPGSPFMSTYNRPADAWTHQSVPDWVPGRRFGEEKPVYVLTSRRTFSAAEALAYSLQAAGRATIVGEQTGGGAHPFEYRRLSAHFALDLPEFASRHPLTGTNWQDVGVTPNVEVPASEALDVALGLAREAITNR